MTHNEALALLNRIKEDIPYAFTHSEIVESSSEEFVTGIFNGVNDHVHIKVRTRSGQSGGWSRQKKQQITRPQLEGFLFFPHLGIALGTKADGYMMGDVGTRFVRGIVFAAAGNNNIQVTINVDLFKIS